MGRLMVAREGARLALDPDPWVAVLREEFTPSMLAVDKSREEAFLSICKESRDSKTSALSSELGGSCALLCVALCLVSGVLSMRA